MSNFWPRGRGGKGRGKEQKALLLFLFLASSLLPTLSSAGPYADLDAALQGKPDARAVAGLKRIAGDDLDAVAALESGPKAARSYIELRAALEGEAPSKVPKIGPAPGGERIASSWLGRALDRLRRPKIELPEPKLSGPSVGLVGPWATIMMWSVLAALGGLAVFLLVRYVRFPKGKRKGGLVDPEEPLRTADAWIEEANSLIAQGRYREAVRGLYVAGLMRFDEAGVARFDRHQTNWEHLRRIEASPKTPEGCDVRNATGRFDRLWYGHLPSTLDDASAMRAWYDGLVAKLAVVRP